MKNPMCDGSGPCADGQVRVLPTGGDGNAILCGACFHREIRWRQERNRELGDAFKFALPGWLDLRVYASESEAGMSIILSEGRGDYITDIKWQRDGKAEIMGGSREDALRYTATEAQEVIESLTAANGRGYISEAV